MSSGAVAAPPIALQHIFGLKGDVKDNVHYIDEMTVLYPAGYNIVLHNTENNKPQKFVPLGTCSLALLGYGGDRPRARHDATITN